MEAQNPLKVLIFANGDINDGQVVRDALSAAPDAWVIAADGGAHQAAFFGLTLDALVGDMDSLNADEVANIELTGAEVRRFPEEKDETDLELALQWAVERGAIWIRIVGGIGDRLDQTLSNVYLLALPTLRNVDVRLVAGKQEAWLMYPGENVVSGAEGDTLSLLPLTGEACGVRTENLYYPLRDETLSFGPARGISNVMQASQSRVWIAEGVLLAVHTIGRA